MMKTDRSPIRRLVWFIDAVLMEERKFAKWSSQHRQDFEQLDKMHQNGLAMHGNSALDRKIQHDHEAILERHKAIHERHHDVARLCNCLMAKIRNGKTDEIDVASELECLSRWYDRIRVEHNQIQTERQQLLREHQRFQRARTPREKLN